MSLTINVNSYISEADATLYLADSLRSTPWDNATTAIREKALVSAYRMLDRANWQGSKTVVSQVQDWPRTGLVDEEGQAIDDATVPQFIIDAQVELALALLVNQNVETEKDSGSNVKSAKAGTAEVEFFSTGTKGTRFPTVVHELIGRYLTTAVAFEGPTVGGLLAESGIETYGLGRGI